MPARSAAGRSSCLSGHARPLARPGLTLDPAPRSTVRRMQRTISELASEAGTSADTLRYYDRLGLLPPSGRTAAGYRIYDDAASRRLRFIRAAQRSGLRLEDVAALLEIWDRGSCPCGHTKELVERRLAEVDAELASLRSTRKELVELARRNDACRTANPSEWSCATVERKGGA